MSFTPTFRSDIGVIDPLGNLVSIVHPRYCATGDTAKELAEILKDLRPVIVMEPPIPNFQRFRFTSNCDVPWVVFSNGSKHNVGLLAGYWERYDPVNAERFCRQEIAVSEQVDPEEE